MSLRPFETTQRILISSTSRFIGEYQAESILLTHAWPGGGRAIGYKRLEEGPTSRSAFMLSFTTPQVEKAPGVMLPNYEGTGEWLCSLLSLLYGKRFDSHGCVESNGSFMLPNLEQFGRMSISTLPQNNHKPRSDIAVALHLREVSRLAPMLMGNTGDHAAISALSAAAKFYCEALRAAEEDPEVAYLHLITAGEILANAHHPQSEDLLDAEIRGVIEMIRKFVPDGNKAACIVTRRLRQIKRRFRLAIEDLVDSKFFESTENDLVWKSLRPEDFSKRVAAAYDLRSKYVHTGLSFGHWIAPRENSGSGEVQIGRPVVGDKDLEKLLALAPTYLGLERVVRYSLIRYAERHGLFLAEQG